MRLTCPVCGYDNINEPTLKWSICPSCGTQFGLSDNGRTNAQLRRDWIHGGAAWQDDYIQAPRNWSPVNQLRNISYECTRADLQTIRLSESVFMTGMIVGDKMHVVITTGRATPTVIIRQQQPKYLAIQKMKARSESYQSKGSIPVAKYCNA